MSFCHLPATAGSFPFAYHRLRLLILQIQMPGVLSTESDAGRGKNRRHKSRDRRTFVHAIEMCVLLFFLKDTSELETLLLKLMTPAARSPDYLSGLRLPLLRHCPDPVNSAIER